MTWLFLLCLGAALGVHPAVAAEEDPRPHILLLVADDLGLGELGVHGNRRFPTPNLDRLAAEGMRFSRSYSNSSVCSPARIAILTGRYPQRFGGRFPYARVSDHGLPGDVATLPSLLAAAGYQTHHVGKWHVGHGRDEFHPMARGFEGFYGFLEQGELPGTYHSPRLRRDRGPPERRSGHLTDLLAAEAISFLRQPHPRPFFLQLWFFAPHAPTQPPARWRRRYHDPRFGLVSALDENIGAILAALRSEGLEQDTLVLFTSDNGAVNAAFNGGYRGGKWSTLEGGLRVPLLARWPGRIAPGSVSHTPAASFDILPTLLEAAGRDPSGLRLDGRSLLDALRSRPAPERRALFWEVLNRFAVHVGGWKLLRSQGDKTFTDAEPTLLVRLDRDPRETRDLSGAFPRRAADLRDTYAWLRRDAMRIDFRIEALAGSVRRLHDRLCFARPGGTARIPHDSRFDISDGEFSLALWVKPDRRPRDAVELLVGKPGAWRLALAPDGRLRAQLGRKSAFPLQLESRRALLPERWTHVGLTIDRLRDRSDVFLDVGLWIDGVADRVTRTSAAKPVAINDADLTLGSAPDGQSAFVGALGGIRFYNADLAADEMAALARRAAAPGSCPRPLWRRGWAGGASPPHS